MGLGESKENVASASSSSVLNPDGTVDLFHSTFTGTHTDGVLKGHSTTYHELLPVAGSLVFDFIAIMTVCLFSIIVIKYYRTKAASKDYKIQRTGDTIMVEMKEFDKLKLELV